MKEVIIILLGIIVIFWHLKWYYTVIKLENAKAKNSELQEENSLIIKWYLSLQSKLNTSRELLRKKKELVKKLQGEILKNKLLKKPK